MSYKETKMTKHSLNRKSPIGKNIGNTQHGMTGTSEHRTWVSMRGRCLNSNDKAYHYYGGRGIKICDRWLNSFSSFLEDMGMKPTKFHTIERVDVNGNYEPSNCIWITKSEQGKNKRKYCNFLELRECPVCKSIYKPKVVYQQFCSKLCFSEEARLRREPLEKEKEEKRKNRIANRISDISCQTCKKIFFPSKRITKFCSKLCFSDSIRGKPFSGKTFTPGKNKK
jgi:hypothetical protein